MDLRFNRRAPFTRWAVDAGILRENFVVVDVGVLGGENPRWHLLGDHLVVYGFDAGEAAILDLKRWSRGKNNRHYHHIAIGNEDGERVFYFNWDNPSSSSFYVRGDGRPGDRKFNVPIRKLDTLLAAGTVQKPDFIKIDVAGFESDVIEGGQRTLGSVLGAEIETNFNVSPVYPESHFVMMQQQLLRHHLLVFDLNFNRVPRPGFAEAMRRSGKSIPEDTGRPATINALFCLDPIDAIDFPNNYSGTPGPFTIDQLIKTMMICELHGLSDIAGDVAMKFRDELGARFDVDKGIALLLDSGSPRAPSTHASRQPIARLHRAMRRALGMAETWR